MGNVKILQDCDVLKITQKDYTNLIIDESMALNVGQVDFNIGVRVLAELEKLYGTTPPKDRIFPREVGGEFIQELNEFELR